MAEQDFARNLEPTVPAAVPVLVRSRFEFRPYTAEMEDLVRALNQRLRAGGSEETFPESHERDLPELAGRDVYQRAFVLLQDGVARGAYMLKYQKFAVGGDIQPIAAGPQLPLSEGIVNPEFVLCGVQIVRDALRRQPLLCAMGMGGIRQPYPRLLRKMGWTMQSVPFHFKVLNGRAFFSNIRYLRNNPVLAGTCDLLNLTGIGPAAARLARSLRRPIPASVRTELASSFAPWADEIWDQCRHEYTFTAVRDSNALDTIYPADNPRFLRIRVSDKDRTLGWAVALDTRMNGHKFFGEMRVGTIADCLAPVQDADAVISAAAQFLEQRGVDIIVSNQASPAWSRALGRAGFVRGPSNYLLAFSRQLAARLPRNDSSPGGIHINRGDGDGPINL